MCREVSLGGALFAALATIGCSKANPAYNVGPGDSPDAAAQADGAPKDIGMAPAADAGSDAARDLGTAIEARDAFVPAPDVASEQPAQPVDVPTDTSAGAAGTYVAGDPTRGNDSNPGTRAAPVRTLSRGLQLAKALVPGGGPQTVFVAQGHYAEKVKLTEDISLLGGHECNAASCTWAQNPAMFDTAIDNVDDEGVLASNGITRRTRLEGFRVRGRSGGSTSPLGSAAITLAGGTPTITGNTIVGGNVTGGGSQSSGINVLAPTGRTDPAGALIDENTITAGSAGMLSAGVFFGTQAGAPFAAVSVATVIGNVIRSGNAQDSFGIAAWSSGVGTLVRGNEIAGGSSPGNSWGIAVGSRMTIDANKINTDPNTVGSCSQAASFCGGIVSFSSTTTITNNVVFGNKGPRTAGLFLQENESPAGVCIVNANTFDGAGSAGSGGAAMSAAIALRIGTCNTCGLSGFAGRIRNNILLGGANQARYGVYEETVGGKTMRPEALDNNDFFFGALAGRTDVLYRLWTGAGSMDLTTLGQLAMVPVRVGPPKNNLDLDPMLDATMHLAKTPPSPCIDKGTAAEAPAVDFERDPRPLGAAVDIGHDEAQ